MVLIRDLFERDPTRPIYPVSSVTQHDPDIVFQELNEYVVTDFIRRDLTDIFDLFLESRRGPVQDVCCWITGFFGSGKSLFLKLLGYVLGNIELRLKDESRINSGETFLSKHAFKPYDVLYKELKTLPLFINLLDLDVAREPSITRIVYIELLRASGYSRISWIAEIERTIRQRGLWGKFLQFVKEKEGTDWDDLRGVIIRTRPVLARGLCNIDPESYPTVEDATASIKDVERELEITPTFLVKRLLEKAEELDPERGRVVILLDEAGQYLDRPERLADLNILAEEISKSGKGKIWLFVTAQEALEDVMSRVPHTPDIARLRDRFQLQIQLTPDNIDTVTKKRMLEKKADPSILGALKEIYGKHVGKLWTSATLVEAKRDYGPLFERSESRFIESYPFMPYHIRLMQEIFNILRSRGAKITGRERTVLEAVRAIMSGIKEREGLAYRPVGSLVTFDLVYDVIEEELEAISSSEEAAIEQISKLGRRGEVDVASVAKVLFLLQNVEWIPCTVENIAAVLYPELGAEKDRLEKDVVACLDALKKGLWVTEKQGTYRLLSEFERSFEQLVREKRSEEDIPMRKRSLSNTVIERLVKDQWKLNRFVYKGIPFDIHVFVDDKELTSKGHIELRLLSPLLAGDKESVSRLKRESIMASNVIFWVCEPDYSYGDVLERAVCTEKVLGEYKPTTRADKIVVEEQRAGLRLLKEDELPRIFERALGGGVIVYRGEDAHLDGRKSIQEVFKACVEQAVKQVFTEFDIFAYRLQRDPQDILAILKWRGGSLPSIYRDLQLVDEKDNILTNRPATSRVIEYLRSQGADRRYGSAILEHFTSPPYGADTGTIRLILATLFRNGSLVVVSGGKQYTSATQAESHQIFVNPRMFNRGLFEIGEETITPQQRDLALKLLSDLFGRKAGPVIDEIDSVISSEVDKRLQECSSLLSKAELIGLPSTPILQKLEASLNQMKADTRIRRVLNFIQCLGKKEEVEEFKSQLKVLRKLKDFDLHEYQLISRFSREVAPQLVSLFPEDSEIVNPVNSLRHSLGAEDFLDRWGSIITAFEGLKKRYERAYHEQHKKTHELIQQAIKWVKEHKAFQKLPDDRKREYLRPLSEIDCPVDEPHLDDRLTCEKCGSTLERLSLHINMVDRRRLDIESNLDKLVEKEEPVSGFKETIRDTSQILPIVKKVEDTARKAVSKGKSVKVDVEVD